MGSRSHPPNFHPLGGKVTPTCQVGHPGQRLGKGMGPSWHFLPSGHLSVVVGNLELCLSSPFGAFPHCQTPTLRASSEEGPIWLRP